ncbi:N-acetyllactosaminide beta-1,6-N-acetylglucosaminyl-transferase-like [Littorina saxatilis]|uniref:N-acetyllactosaminide beta-1,6-N-acetylglucosaminyl-transferase-like n=1 Tax=Littorina saxatilis TaxID=31220 RepID=UPI0038B56B2C
MRGRVTLVVFWTLLMMLTLADLLYYGIGLEPVSSPVLPTCTSNNESRDFDHILASSRRDFVQTSRATHTAQWRQQRSPSTSYSVRSVSCPLLWRGNPAEQERAERLQFQRPRCQKSLEDFLRVTENCTDYVHNGGFMAASVSEEERAFPLAFSILVYKHPEQVERLLRAIYRPHNVYCIHVDIKSGPVFQHRMALFARCLPNVFLSNESVDVRWGKFTNLEPEVICIRQLLEHSGKWRYFINLTGQEFPLKTNKELVRILTAFKGANQIGKDSKDFSDRWESNLPAPYHLSMTKGDVHIAAVRGFVDYAINSNVARRFLEWEKLNQHPDESFFNTLNFDPRLGAPGSSVDVPKAQKITLLRYKVWCPDNLPCYCRGKIIRDICQYGVQDLPMLTSSDAMFANKFSYENEPVGYDCLEQWLLHKVHREEAGQSLPLNISVYENSWLVRHRYTGPVKIW